MTKRYKRRNYMINPGFQLRFLFYFAFSVLFGLCLIYLSNLWYFDVITQQGQEIGLDPSHPYYEFIENQNKLLTKTYLTVSSLLFVALMIFGVLLSHHIAGPLYRIKTYMNTVATGEKEMRPVTLRKGDFFEDVADSLNNMLDALCKQRLASQGLCPNCQKVIAPEKESQEKNTQGTASAATHCN